jgi:1-phosphatidylinositol phosphodiesterase
MGIHPTNWPDSVKEGFEWMCNDIVVRTSDWYHIPSFLSIPEKVVLSTEVLQPSPAYADRQVLPITFFSASSFPLAAPPTISQGFGWPSWGMGVEGVNSRVAKWALEQLAGSSSGDEKAKVTEPTIRGWTFMDYFTEPDNALVPLLVEFNFRGREPAQEGWRNLFRRG